MSDDRPPDSEGEQPYGSIEALLDQVHPALAGLAESIEAVDRFSDTDEPGEVVPTVLAQQIRGAIARLIAADPAYADPPRDVVARDLRKWDADGGQPTRDMTRAIAEEGVRLNLRPTPQGNVWRGICLDVREEKGLPDPL